MDEKRNFKLDNIKLLMLFLVIIGHFIEVSLLGNDNAATQIYTYIYIFHMPLMLLISGNFAKKYTNYYSKLKRFASIMFPISGIASLKDVSIP